MTEERSALGSVESERSAEMISCSEIKISECTGADVYRVKCGSAKVAGAFSLS